MLPPPEILGNMKSKEEPAAYPSGPNTSFHNLTPMPHRFTEEALPAVNVRHEEPAKDEHPCYTTTAGEIGRLPMEGSDLPMRWYGRSGIFTSGWVAEPKTKVNSGLNTGMDRSDIHQKCAAASLARPCRPRCATQRSSPLSLCSILCASHADGTDAARRTAVTTRAGRASWVSTTTTLPTCRAPSLWARRRGDQTARARRAGHQGSMDQGPWLAGCEVWDARREQLCSARARHEAAHLH